MKHMATTHTNLELSNINISKEYLKFLIGMKFKKLDETINISQSKLNKIGKK